MFMCVTRDYAQAEDEKSALDESVWFAFYQMNVYHRAVAAENLDIKFSLFI